MKVKKKEMKLLSFIDDMAGSVKNTKEFTEKELELISEFSKVTFYIVNIQKSII